MKRNPAELAAYLDAVFKEKKLPGMQVVIRGPKDFLFERSFGMRSIRKNLPVNSETMFGIASMSKSMTALALCILTAEGRMSLEDPVVKYFPDFHIKGAPDDAVTVKTLAMHTAGIPPIEPLEWSIAMNSNREDSPWLRAMRASSPNQMDRIEHIIEYITNMPYKPLGAPGEYMSYSNEGYAIMSYIVDQVAGIPLEQFLTERIFNPLGMTRTIQDIDCTQAKELSGGNFQSSFEFHDDGTLAEDESWSVCPPFRGCACVKTTALDVTRYYKCLCDNGIWEGKQVIPAEAVRLMFGPQFPLEKERHYCMGLNKSLICGKMVCEHSGGLHGVSSEGALIEGGYSVAVLCNCGDVDLDWAKWACFNFIFGRPFEETHYWCEPIEKEFSNPEMLTGKFTAHEGIPSSHIFRLKNGKLTGSYGSIKNADIRYCGGMNFAVYNPKTGKRVTTLTFYVRNGKAWGVKCGSRIYQRA